MTPRPAAPSRAEARALLCRPAYEAWARQCSARGLVAPYPLPARYALASRQRAGDVLETHPERYGNGLFHQSVASLHARAKQDASQVLGHDSVAIAPRAGEDTCPCCAPAGQLARAPTFWSLSHRDHSGTRVDFDADSQVTTIWSTFHIRGPRDVLPRPRELDRLIRHLADQFDPRNWSAMAGESFSRSEARDLLPRDPRWPGKQSWAGQLLEVFDWSWNPEATMSIENLLDITYQVGKPERDHGLDRPVITLEYSLAESLSSKLWLARQPGGLDLDRGGCWVEIHGFREVQPAGKGATAAPVHARLRSSPYFNIAVRAKKMLRFSLQSDAPDWLTILINYLTPVMGGIWMDRAVQTGAWNAIRLSGGVPTYPVPGPRPTEGARKEKSDGREPLSPKRDRGRPGVPVSQRLDRAVQRAPQGAKRRRK
jgi:hypothetical protein